MTDLDFRALWAQALSYEEFVRQSTEHCASSYRCVTSSGQEPAPRGTTIGTGGHMKTELTLAKRSIMASPIALYQSFRDVGRTVSGSTLGRDGSLGSWTAWNVRIQLAALVHKPLVQSKGTQATLIVQEGKKRRKPVCRTELNGPWLDAYTLKRFGRQGLSARRGLKW